MKTIKIINLKNKFYSNCFKLAELSGFIYSQRYFRNLILLSVNNFELTELEYCTLLAELSEMELQKVLN